MAKEVNRPLFHRFLNREAINFRSSIGKEMRNGNNTAQFAGELALNNPLGTYWPDLNQAGALNITVGDDAEVGGNDRVKIVSDGNTITLDPGVSWINVSGAFDTNPGAINIASFHRVSSSEVEYSVVNL